MREITEELRTEMMVDFLIILVCNLPPAKVLDIYADCAACQSRDVIIRKIYDQFDSNQQLAYAISLSRLGKYTDEEICTVFCIEPEIFRFVVDSVKKTTDRVN